MSEERFAYHLRQRLNRGLDAVSPSVLRRLEASRHHALAHQRQEVRVAGLAMSGHHGFGGHAWFDDVRFRQLAAVVLLLLGIFFAVYWQGQQYVRDIEDVDSALLADDIPPDAFLDKGFAAWLDDSSVE